MFLECCCVSSIISIALDALFHFILTITPANRHQHSPHLTGRSQGTEGNLPEITQLVSGYRKHANSGRLHFPSSLFALLFSEGLPLASYSHCCLRWARSLAFTLQVFITHLLHPRWSARLCSKAGGRYREALPGLASRSPVGQGPEHSDERMQRKQQQCLEWGLGEEAVSLRTPPVS